MKEKRWGREADIAQAQATAAMWMENLKKRELLCGCLKCFEHAIPTDIHSHQS